MVKATVKAVRKRDKNLLPEYFWGYNFPSGGNKVHHGLDNELEEW
jgi:hypothetical protein